MRYRINLFPVIGALLIFACLSCSPPGGSGSQSGGGIAAETVARELLDLLVAEDFAAAHARFLDALQWEFPIEQLVETWAWTVGEVGSFQSVQETSTSRDGEVDTVDILCQFESGLVNVTVVVDPDGAVRDLSFGPV